ncbi:type VII secretion-associated serine protease mycosin [Streptomyces sp. MS1.AVA.1]|uniref:Type VII secretion-associated serine protease mycosin n=1 Tax=Streptomyces machairae TaxID=3134109 RepID=A0ABU8UR49_9ACTN
MQDTWAETQGEGVTVAVVDSGVDGTHADLAGQVLEGKDFTGGGNAREDLDGHGTSMASLIAAHGHGAGNASGMVGLAPKAKIMPLRVIQTQKDPNHDETWAAAVRYAVDHGAKVINLSFGNDGGKTLSDGREAISYAQAHDVVVVASAGNEGSVAVEEPAALPGVVSVGAVDKEGNRWENSNTGKGLTLMAPGVEVLAADKTRSQQYSLSNGTSDATAYVSATAALVRAKYPDLTAGQVINRLLKSASFLGHKGLKAPDEEYGYGIIRPRQAVTMDIPAGPEEPPRPTHLLHLDLQRGGQRDRQVDAGQKEEEVLLQQPSPCRRWRRSRRGHRRHRLRGTPQPSQRRRRWPRLRRWRVAVPRLPVSPAAVPRSRFEPGIPCLAGAGPAASRPLQSAAPAAGASRGKPSSSVAARGASGFPKRLRLPQGWNLGTHVGILLNLLGYRDEDRALKCLGRGDVCPDSAPVCRVGMSIPQ